MIYIDWRGRNEAMSKMLADAHMSTDTDPLPDLKEVFRELRKFVEDAVKEELKVKDTWIHMRGIPFFKSDSLLILPLLHSDDCGEMMQRFLDKQPRILYQHSDYDEQLRLRTELSSDVPQGHCRDFTQVLSEFANDDQRVLPVLLEFQRVMNELLYVAQLRNPLDIGRVMHILEMETRAKMSFPFTLYGFDFETRQQLAKMNFEGMIGILLKDISVIVEGNTPPFHAWLVQKHFICLVKHVMETIPENRILENIPHGWNGFFTDHPIPVANYDIERIIMHADEESESDASLEDVLWEADEEPRAVDICSIPVSIDRDVAGTVCTICQEDVCNLASALDGSAIDDPNGPPMEVKCGHVFHSACLAEYINGIESYSILCQQCRKTICKPRRKRRVVDDVGEEEVDG
jgi:hypothetical protein